MAITTTSVLAPQVQLSFNKKLLAIPTPNLIHKIPAEMYTLPKNGGDTLRMTRYNRLPSSLVPLGNSGVTPPSTTMSAMNIDAKVSYYGQYVEINEQCTLQRSDPVLNSVAEELGKAMRLTEDELTRNMLQTTASFINCVGGVNGDTPTELTRSDIDEVVSRLLGQDGEMFTDIIQGENRFGTAPVRNAYLALAHTKITASLGNVAGFIHTSQYPSQTDVKPSEWGNVANVRFFVSSNGSVTPNSSMLSKDIYNVFVCARQAIGVVDQEGYNAEMIYNGPELNGPLRLNSTAGYKFAGAYRILNDAWVMNLRCTL